MSSKILVIIDAMAVLYRAFYAIRELSTRSGRPTNAVYGFVRMLTQIKKLWQPSHLVVVFDGGLPVERVKLLPEYKAQRKAMPDALREQISVVEDYLDRSGVARVRIDGEEADDLIATIAMKAEREADKVLIASNDKDMYQIVCEKIQMTNVSGSDGLMGPREVKEKTGVMPFQIVDWLVMTGDSSDNIPGVKGIGTKTAANLLNEYGSMVNILNSIDKIGGKIAESLKSSRGIVERNEQMLRLKSDMDFAFKWSDFEVKTPDSTALLSLFEELEFDSMAKELRQKELF